MGGRFAGRVAAVTGGGSGIGAAVARRFAAEGAKVAILELAIEHAEGVRGEITDRGGAAVALATDVSSPASVSAAFAAIADRIGSLDVLVNCAGITLPAPLREMTDEQWRRVLAVNLKGTFLCAQAAAAVFRARRSGRIVNISSIALLGGPLGRVNYTASKAGVLGLTRALAMELAQYDVNVNAVAPGAVDTPMTAKAQTRERWQKVREVTPLGRIGRPEDIAAAVLFLASDDASFITGQCLFVCGGRSILGDAP